MQDETRRLLDQIIEKGTGDGVEFMRHMRTTHDLSEFLSDDLKEAHELFEFTTADFAARTIVRTMAAEFEAQLFLLQGILLHLHKRGKLSLLPEEVVVLRGKAYSLSHTGEIKSSEKFSPFTANLLFTIKLCGEKFNGSVFADTQDDNWQHVLKFVRIRNRLMHPRTMSDVQISERDVESLNRAQDWIRKAFRSVVGR